MEGGKQRMNNQISHLAPGSSIAELLPSTAALLWPCCRSGRRNLCVIGARSEAARSPAGRWAGRQAGRPVPRRWEGSGLPVPQRSEGSGLPDRRSCTDSPSGCAGRAELCQPALHLRGPLRYHGETTIPLLRHPICFLS